MGIGERHHCIRVVIGSADFPDSYKGSHSNVNSVSDSCQRYLIRRPQMLRSARRRRLYPWNFSDPYRCADSYCSTVAINSYQPHGDCEWYKRELIMA